MSTLETERLYYKPFTLDMLEDINRQFSDPDMCKYFSDPPCTLQEAKELIYHYMDAEGKGFHRLSLYNKVTNDFIGTIGYHYLSTKKRHVEIGYDIWKAYWGQGYASEAIPVILQICFNELHVERVYILVHPENTASIKAVMKFGFTVCEPCRPIDQEPQICLSVTKEHLL